MALKKTITIELEIKTAEGDIDVSIFEVQDITNNRLLFESLDPKFSDIIFNKAELQEICKEFC